MYLSLKKSLNFLSLFVIFFTLTSLSAYNTKNIETENFESEVNNSISNPRSPMPDSRNIKSEILNLKLSQNPFKYSGYYYDSESGMYYLNARYYSPELMRFISRDTYDLSNRYTYCGGNPTSNIDPSGHNFSSAMSSNLNHITDALVAGSFGLDLLTMGTTGAATGALMCGSALTSAASNILLEMNAGSKLTSRDYLSIGFAITGSCLGLYATNPELFDKKMQGSAIINECLAKQIKLDTEEINLSLRDPKLADAFNKGKAMLGSNNSDKYISNKIKNTIRWQNTTNQYGNSVSQAFGGTGNAIANSPDNRNDEVSPWIIPFNNAYNWLKNK